ncbi:MAG: hypothetical protein ACU0GG_08220 [Paracoccaceae bacterium]
MSKTLKDVQHDSVELHALTQGMEELLNCETRAARNAVHALSSTLIEKADQLSIDLDNLEREARK